MALAQVLDDDDFSDDPIEFQVDHKGKSHTFFVMPASVKEFGATFKKSSDIMDANMRRTFKKFLLDEDQQPIAAEVIDKLLNDKKYFAFALKINAGINSALGLDELAKKG